MPILKTGSTGPDVLALQQALAKAGFNPGTLDGGFGSATQAAVIAFQRSENLPPDGVVGPRTAASLGLTTAPSLPSAIPSVTVAVVSRMFPSTPVANIRQHLPVVLDALAAPGLTDRFMVLMALATIRAEAECFAPVAEGQSRFNTSPAGHPFDLYDFRRDLGNQGPPDGERYRGRGFVQLTGRANYARHGEAIGLADSLVANPDLACDPVIAAKLLASFLESREVQIKTALHEGNLGAARRLVNGGSNGLDRFSDAFLAGQGLLPDALGATA